MDFVDLGRHIFLLSPNVLYILGVNITTQDEEGLCLLFLPNLNNKSDEMILLL